MLSRTLRQTLPLALGVGLGVVAGTTVYKAAHVTRMMVVGLRQPTTRLPADMGMPTEAVAFPASDGVTLRGWFLPCAGADGTPAPTVAFVHGWPWNRTGNTKGSTIVPDRTVDFLPTARALHNAGFNVLLFDLRNHGASDSSMPVSFGLFEANDVVGAVEMLRARPDVDGERIGLLGFSMGANAALYAVPRCQPIGAVLAVQPVKATTFAPTFTRDVLGMFGPALARLAEPIHETFGAPPLADVDPAEAARHLGDTAVLYVQGNGDRWGTVEDVRAMVAATPNAREAVIVPSGDRYGGYLFASQRTDDVVRFFEEELGV